MKILYIEWNGLCASDVKSAMKNLGHEYKTISTPIKDKFEVNYDFAEAVEEAISVYKPKIVFSMNYFPSVSIACQNKRVRYVSWIYDNPHTAVYHISAKNLCNYIFSFDSDMVEQLRSRGVEHIYYAPLAVNCNRVKNINISQEKKEKYACEVAFVGSLYNEGTDYYSTILAKANDKHLEGFLEGVLNSQKLVYGYNFMAEALTPDIVEQIRNAVDFLLPEDSLLTEREIYADVFLSRKLATINRVELLYWLGREFAVNFYTYNQTMIPNIKHCGTVSYTDEMPCVFHEAKININDTRRSIKKGIPLRAMDIMGCGGFLLSNYQEDFLKHFEHGRHMELYGSIEEARDKCEYYLRHETERSKIAENAYKIMEQEHTYEIRLNQMLEKTFEE